MNIQQEFEKIKDYLKEAEQSGEMNPKAKAFLQDKFFLSFTLIALQQEKIVELREKLDQTVEFYNSQMK